MSSVRCDTDGMTDPDAATGNNAPDDGRPGDGRPGDRTPDDGPPDYGELDARTVPEPNTRPGPTDQGGHGGMATREQEARMRRRQSVGDGHGNSGDPSS